MIGHHTIGHYVFWVVVAAIAAYIYYRLIVWAENQKDQ